MNRTAKSLFPNRAMFTTLGFVPLIAYIILIPVIIDSP